MLPRTYPDRWTVIAVILLISAVFFALNSMVCSLEPELNNFYLDLPQSLADMGFAKSLDRSTGMPMFFANPPPSRSRHISSEKIAQFRLK